jgi:hypothetical protein
METKLQSIDIPRLQADEEYYRQVHDEVWIKDYKPTDEEIQGLQLAAGYYIIKENKPSTNPTHHNYDLSKVRKVGLSKLLQDLSNYFA